MAGEREMVTASSSASAALDAADKRGTGRNKRGRRPEQDRRKTRRRQVRGSEDSSSEEDESMVQEEERQERARTAMGLPNRNGLAATGGSEFEAGSQPEEGQETGTQEEAPSLHNTNGDSGHQHQRDNAVFARATAEQQQQQHAARAIVSPGHRHQKHRSGTVWSLSANDYLVVKNHIVGRLFKKVKFISSEEQLSLSGKIANNILDAFGVRHDQPEKRAGIWECIRPTVKANLNQKRSNINGEIKKAYLRKLKNFECAFCLFDTRI